jgi:hypothetical protein
VHVMAGPRHAVPAALPAVMSSVPVEALVIAGITSQPCVRTLLLCQFVCMLEDAHHLQERCTTMLHFSLAATVAYNVIGAELTGCCEGAGNACWSVAYGEQPAMAVQVACVSTWLVLPHEQQLLCRKHGVQEARCGCQHSRCKECKVSTPCAKGVPRACGAVEEESTCASSGSAVCLQQCCRLLACCVLAASPAS